MAVRDIVTNLITHDKSSKPLKDAASAAKSTARSYDELSIAEKRLALAAEKAGVAVDKASRSAANAEQRYGRESEQAREASRRLREAQLNLAEAEEKVAREARKAGDAADDATKQVRQLADASDRAKLSANKSGGALGWFGGIAGKIVPTLGMVTARLGAFGTVGLSLIGPTIALGAHVAALAVQFGRAAAAVGPAAASLPGLAAGVLFAKTTIGLAAPGIMKGLKPITDAFLGTPGKVGGKKTMLGGLQQQLQDLAGRGLPSLSKQFLRVNFPAIADAMRRIAVATNSVVVGVGKWINSGPGQAAVRTIVQGTASAAQRLAPHIVTLAAALGNLTARAGGQAFQQLSGALNKVIDGVSRFLDRISTQDIDRAWKQVDRYAGAIGDFVKKIPGWIGAIGEVGRWWRRNATEIQHVRDVLGLVTIAVGVATGGWIPAIIAAISLLIIHWDQVSAAMSRVKVWFRGTSDSAGNVREVLGGLRAGVADLVSWFRGQLVPALERAAHAVMPSVRDAISTVTKALHDNRDIVMKVEGVLSALGVIITDVIIPALSLLARVVIPLVVWQFKQILGALNQVVLPGIRIFVHVVLFLLGELINEFADMWGWIPGIGPKLRQAATQFNTFAKHVNDALAGIKDQHVNVSASIRFSPSQVVKSQLGAFGHASGGLVTGPGGPRDDKVPAMLSNKEYVVNAASTAKHLPVLEAINSGRHMAGGGLVVSGQTSGLPQTMAAERKALLAAAKAMAPSLSGGNVGAGVRRWAPLVAEVLAELGQPGSALGPVLSRMQRESGGNPQAINLWDSNARAGDPSRGLMQTIGSTFAAFAGPYRRAGIYDPHANIYAGVNYAVHRYGADWISRMLAGGGYDQGGLARGAGLIAKGPRPERVLSPAQTVRFERAMSAAGGAPVYEVHVHAPHYVGGQRELVGELVKALQSGQADVITRKIAEQVRAR